MTRWLISIAVGAALGLALPNPEGNTEVFTASDLGVLCNWIVEIENTLSSTNAEGLAVEMAKKSAAALQGKKFETVWYKGCLVNQGRALTNFEAGVPNVGFDPRVSKSLGIVVYPADSLVSVEDCDCLWAFIALLNEGWHVHEGEIAIMLCEELEPPDELGPSHPSYQKVREALRELWVVCDEAESLLAESGFVAAAGGSFGPDAISEFVTQSANEISNHSATMNTQLSTIEAEANAAPPGDPGMTAALVEADKMKAKIESKFTATETTNGQL